MKSTQALNLVKFAACVVLVVGSSASAFASCGDTLSAMAAAAAPSASHQPQTMQPDSESSKDNGAHPSIVGLWHIEFLVGDAVIQEAFQLWNLGGTEVHNPRVDPRGGNVYLGVWRQLRATHLQTHTPGMGLRHDWRLPRGFSTSVRRLPSITRAIHSTAVASPSICMISPAASLHN